MNLYDADITFTDEQYRSPRAPMRELTDDEIRKFNASWTLLAVLNPGRTGVRIGKQYFNRAEKNAALQNLTEQFKARQLPPTIEREITSAFGLVLPAAEPAGD